MDELGLRTKWLEHRVQHQSSNFGSSLSNFGGTSRDVLGSRSTPKSKEMRDMFLELDQEDDEEHRETAFVPQKRNISTEEWLSEVKTKMMETVEWQALTREMYANVQQALSKNHAQYFADLTTDEKIIMIDDIEDSIAGGNVFQNFAKELHNKLDGGLLELLARRHRDKPGKTRQEKIVEYAAEGATSMLTRIPSNISRVRLLLNQNIPHVLRKEVWDMILHDAEALQGYKNRVNAKRLTTIAAQDSEVTERCQTIFENDFPEINNSSALVMVGKTVLSYRMTAYGVVEDAQYYLIIPLLLVFAVSYKEVSRVVEALQALMSMNRPRCDQTDSLKKKKLADQFAEMLKKADLELYTHIINRLDEGNQDFPKQKLLGMVEIPVERLLVGTLNLETCQYVWDQCLLVGFDRLLFPFIVCLLILLRRQLLVKTTFDGMKQVIQYQGKSISPSMMSRMVEKLFMGEIRSTFSVSLRGMSHWKNEPVGPLKDNSKISELYSLDEDDDEEEESEQALTELEKEEKSEEEIVQEQEQLKARFETKLQELYPSIEPEQKEPEITLEQQEEEEPDIPLETPKTTTPPVSSRSEEPFLVPPVVTPWNHLADTLKRAKEMNDEDVDETKLQEFLVAKHPEFAEQEPDVPVLKVRIKEKYAFFRCLKTGEPESNALEIIKQELTRLGLLEDQQQSIEKLEKHLLRYSKAKGSYEEKERGVSEKEQDVSEQKSDSEVLKLTVLRTIEALKTLKSLKK